MSQKISSYHAALERLQSILSHGGMTIDEVKKILIPDDPWQAARGLWQKRTLDPVKEQRRLRKQWNRNQ